MPNVTLYVAATSYFATSIFFFCFPNLLHTRKKYKDQFLQDAIDGKKILRISHRGGPRYTTQNTIEAFRKVYTISDMLEMDVCETKDKVLVVHHDRSLERTCGVKKNINELNYAELPPFSEEIALDFSEGKTVVSNNEKIPTFEQVLQIFRGTLIDVELKTPTESSIKEMSRLIREYDMEDQVIVGIRNSQQNQLFKMGKDLKIFSNDYRIFTMTLLYFTGLLPFVPIRETSVQLPLYTTEFHNWKLETNTCSKFKTNCFFTGVKILDFICQPLYWHLQKRGIFTFFWVCNEEEHYERAIKLGAQGIMTDDPYLLNSFLEKKNGSKQKKE